MDWDAHPWVGVALIVFLAVVATIAVVVIVTGGV